MSSVDLENGGDSRYIQYPPPHCSRYQCRTNETCSCPGSPKLNDCLSGPLEIEGKRKQEDAIFDDGRESTAGVSEEVAADRDL